MTFLERLRNPAFQQGAAQGLYQGTLDFPYGSNPLLEAIFAGNQGLAIQQQQQLEQQALEDERRRKEDERRRAQILQAASLGMKDLDLAKAVFGDSPDTADIFAAIAAKKAEAEAIERQRSAAEVDRMARIFGDTDEGPPARDAARKMDVYSSFGPGATRDKYLRDIISPPKEEPPEFDDFTFGDKRYRRDPITGDYKVILTKPGDPPEPEEPVLSPDRLASLHQWAYRQAKEEHAHDPQARDARADELVKDVLSKIGLDPAIGATSGADEITLDKINRALAAKGAPAIPEAKVEAYMRAAGVSRREALQSLAAKFGLASTAGGSSY